MNRFGIDGLNTRNNMKAKLEPITFLGDTITTLSVWVNQYTLGTDTAYIHWQLSDDDGKNCKDGDINLTGTIIQNWGTDDEPIFNEIASSIGVTITEFVTE
jgi:hypothetical protein